MASEQLTRYEVTREAALITLNSPDTRNALADVYFVEAGLMPAQMDPEMRAWLAQVIDLVKPMWTIWISSPVNRTSFSRLRHHRLKSMTAPVKLSDVGRKSRSAGIHAVGG